MAWTEMSGKVANEYDQSLRATYERQSFLRIDDFLPAELHNSILKEVNDNASLFETHLKEPRGPLETVASSDPRIPKMHMEAENFIRDSLFSYCYRLIQLMNMPRSGPTVEMIKDKFHKANLRRIASLTGHNIDKTLFVGISRHLPGDFLGPHRDLVHTNDKERFTAFNYCLDRPANSGDLVYLEQDGSERAVVMKPNSLSLFDLKRSGVHYVRPASSDKPYRTSIVGFLCKGLETQAPVSSEREPATTK